MEPKIFITVSIGLLLFYKGACKEEVKYFFEVALN